MKINRWTIMGLFTEFWNLNKGYWVAACAEPRLFAGKECGTINPNKSFYRWGIVARNRVISMLGFDRITFDPNVMGGRACIRDIRVTVSLIVNLVANGMSIEEIIEAYPYLESEDVRQALRYAPRHY